MYGLTELAMYKVGVFTNTNLLKGPRNHRGTYADDIESHGVIYEAQYIDQDEADSIVGSQVERGTKQP